MSRQIIQYSRTLGFYKPSTFRIHISTNFSFSRFDDRDWSVFAHEYMHFIQDISTVNGAYNIYVISEYLKSFASAQKEAPNREVHLPYFPDDSFNVNTNQCLNELTFGNSGESDGLRITDLIPEKENLGNILGDIDVAKFKVEYADGHQEDVYFGANAVKESMAYIMESYIAPVSMSAQDYPYRFADMVVEFIYPEFAVDRLNVLALCDIALLSSNPGPVFVWWLDKS